MRMETDSAAKSCCPISGSLRAEAGLVEAARRVDKASARLSIEAIAAPTLRQ